MAEESGAGGPDGAAAEDASSAVERLEKDLEERNKALAERDAEVKRLEKSVGTKEKELKNLKDKAKEYIIKTKQDLKQRDLSIKKLEQANKQLSEQKKDLDKELELARDQKKSADSGSEKVVSQLKQDHEKQIKDLEASFEAERTSLRKQQKLWAAQREESHSTDMSTLMENNKLLKTKFIEAQEEVKEMTTKTTALSQELAERKREETELKNRFRARLEKVNEELRAKRMQERQLESSQHKLDWAERRMVVLQKEIDGLKAQQLAQSVQQQAQASQPLANSAAGGQGNSDITANNNAVGVLGVDGNTAGQGQLGSGKGGEKLALIRAEMQKEELKAKHAAELAKVQHDLMKQIAELQAKLKEAGSSDKQLLFPAASSSSPRMERNLSVSEQIEDAKAEGLSLDEQVKYWKEQKLSGDEEMSRMEQALESLREQITTTKELSVDNLRLKQDLADANRAKLQAQHHSLKLDGELSKAGQKLQVSAKELDDAQQKHRQLSAKIAELDGRLRSTNIEALRSKLNKEHTEQLNQLKAKTTVEVGRLERLAKQAQKQAESDRKKRNYAKTEFLKVFNELEGLRKEVGKLRIDKDVARKRYQARISDLENLLGIEEDAPPDLELSLGSPPQDQHRRARKDSADSSSASFAESGTNMFDIQLVQVPSTLADITYEDVEGRVRGISKRTRSFLERCRKEGGKSSSSIDDSKQRMLMTHLDDEELFSSPMAKGAQKRPLSLSEEAGVILEGVERMLDLIREVSSHQKKCQVAITNLGASAPTHAGGCAEGIRLICKAMCGSGNTPTGVPKKERRGEYKYSQVP
mmetsp:Transcript_4460/g.8134  ORF Transcript_4460/g.8134 Transcript_4460/m.8134 type:complete len:814 (-) Transcript_4460:391-2832(-)